MLGKLNRVEPQEKLLIVVYMYVFRIINKSFVIAAVQRESTLIVKRRHQQQVDSNEFWVFFCRKKKPLKYIFHLFFLRIQCKTFESWMV